MKKMGAKRCSKVKEGWAVSDTTSAVLEGCKNLSTQYKGAAEANPLNCILLFFRGEVRADKNGGYGVRADSSAGGGSSSVSVRPPYCVTVTPVHDFHRLYQPANN